MEMHPHHHHHCCRCFIYFTHLPPSHQIAHVWYRFLDKRFVFKSTAAATATATAAAVDSPVSRFSWSVLKPVFIKVCLDEAIMGTFEIVYVILPYFYLCHRYYHYCIS